MARDSKPADLMPRPPIHVIIEPIRHFMHIESASGVVLLAVQRCPGCRQLAAGRSLSGILAAAVRLPAGRVSPGILRAAVDQRLSDGDLFHAIGLEVKRELVLGELRDFRRAVLPLAAALGGMIVPAATYLLLQHGAPGERGWGIPMATDIAFVVGCLAVLGSRIPVSLRIMLLSLAIADDIGAILVIAIGYTGNVNWAALAGSVAAVALIIGLMRLGVRNKAIYLFLALGVWYAVHESGIHATIAGVVVGFLTPARARISERRLGLIIDNALHFIRGEGWRAANERYAVLRQMERAARGSIAPLERFETGLHPWVGFAIMPLFALANAGVRFELSDLADPVAVAVMLGLVIGKPIGILLLSWLAVKTGLARLPRGVNWAVVTGGGFLAGIGFTMAIFISGLALQGVMLGAAKVGFLAGSVVSAVIGMVLLVVFLPKTAQPHG